ncbi:MAG: hypothetical protein DHS20C14_06040 [Phycisphaeraceae bacterium]|nr:MAG: hypothetical protein DHS20C14_06040 [Phycisphaeraceae bacterium]
MPRTTPAALALLAILPLGACSEDEPEQAPPPLSSSYLESLEEETSPKRLAARAPEPPAENADDEPEDTTADDAAVEDEPERDLREARTSRSTLGKTRDRARSLRNEMSGGATTGSPIADTGFDEMWIETRGLHWDVPEPWLIAIPTGDIKGELVVEHDIGNGQILFYVAETDAVRALQQVGRTFTDDLGAPQRPRPTKADIAGRTVHRISTDGTFSDPNDRSTNDKPFWALRAAAIEIDDETSVVVLFRGPEDTVKQNAARWDAMIEGMTTR